MSQKKQRMGGKEQEKEKDGNTVVLGKWTRPECAQKWLQVLVKRFRVSRTKVFHKPRSRIDSRVHGAVNNEVRKASENSCAKVRNFDFTIVGSH